MPKKYHIHVHATPNRFPVVGRSGIVDWGEGCLKCAVCVKQRCVYGVYKSRTFSTDILSDTIDELCKSCFRCVQDCPRRLIHKTINPEWEALGDDVYTPQIIAATWEQANTGKIPVSGAGYGGPFSGPGFDSMWTDMSEIVRPTRDGIHGREYISTVVDLGRRPGYLKFGSEGNLFDESQPFIRIPIPLIFDVLPFGDLSPQVWKAVGAAAVELQTLAIVPETVARDLAGFENNLVPLLSDDRFDGEWVKNFRMVEIPDGDKALDRKEALKAIKPNLLVSIRMQALASKEQAARVADYARAGFDLIHFVADERGYEPGVEDGLHIKDVIRSLHSALLSEGIRDEVTVMSSGGVAMAEHVIKSLLCGANVVGVDIPLLIALECRVCRNCREGGECPVDISGIDARWGVQRIINLIGAWHNQLLEMMGAMGIREARRLRGEQGRVLFMEDLERETFGRLFARDNS
ncbi:glutamate synthase-related protein [Desulfomonile tiedjei]|uniref:glutamate synthase (NADPH) n=1 Tax=Desulfomonile tiedjei (strain ATCC 49306 / DSM 6799 / DCB-1) TaxID=706587 RepID=I4C7S6_DESTA|nr:glutamate synthase-related protein [Desulfomonile tiedjei]AFM25617.1 glutamate synthase family protein [Desulfomonile tiedjei DSM 6799]